MLWLTVSERYILYPLLSFASYETPDDLLEAVSAIQADDALMRDDLNGLKNKLDTPAFNDVVLSRLVEDARNGNLLSPMPYRV